MPKIPGTDQVYTQNTFMLAEKTTFDVPCIVPDGGGALISLREYFDADETYGLVPTGNSDYEYVSLYPLFAESKLYAMKTVIEGVSTPVQGHPETTWDLTSHDQILWLLNEDQLLEILYENTIMQTFDDIKFTVNEIQADAMYGFMLSDTLCDLAGAPLADASDLSAEGMAVSRLLVSNRDESDSVRLRFVPLSKYIKCINTQKFDEIKIRVDGVKYRLFLDSEPGGREPQYIRGLTQSLYDYFKANDSTEITVGVLGKYGK